MRTKDDVQRKGKGHPHLTPLEVQAIANARSNGMSIKALTSQFNVSRQTIYNAIKASTEGRMAPAKEDAPLPETRRRAPRVTPAFRKVICDWCYMRDLRYNHCVGKGKGFVHPTTQSDLQVGDNSREII